MLRFISGYLVVVAAAAAFEMPALRSRFGMGCKIEEDCFKTLPRTSCEAKDMGWVAPPETVNDFETVKMSTLCEPDNPRLCILVDNKGSICGLQLSIVKAVEDQKQVGLNYTEKGFQARTLFGQEMLTNQMFFVPQETIVKGGREFDNNTGTGLWLKTKGGELTEIPLLEADMPGGTVFKKQNCFAAMGSHHFYNNTKELTPQDFHGWFITYDKNEEGVSAMNGYGFIAYGRKVDPLADLTYEDVPAAVVKAIAPDSPQFVYDYIKEYGIFSQHVYFVNKPWEIKCNK